MAEFTMSTEVFEAMEEMELKLEEMQILCEEQSKKRIEIEKRFNSREHEFNIQKQTMNEEIVKLKKSYANDMKQKHLKDNLAPPAWLQDANFENEEKILDLQQQNSTLSAALNDRDVCLETLKWKLQEAETSITLLTAERSQLALEADELALRVQQYDYALDFPNKKQDVEVQTEKIINPRHSSEYEHITSEDIAHNDDNDDISTGGLVRAANFSNICALDESLDFKMADKLSMANSDVMCSKSFTSLTNACSVSSLYNSTHSSYLNIHSDGETCHASNPNLRRHDNPANNYRSSLHDFPTRNPKQTFGSISDFNCSGGDFKPKQTFGGSTDFTCDGNFKSKMIFGGSTDFTCGDFKSKQTFGGSSTDFSNAKDINTDFCSIKERKRASEVHLPDESLPENSFADDFSKLSISELQSIGDEWSFTPESILDVSTGKLVTGEEAINRTRSHSVAIPTKKEVPPRQQTLEIPEENPELSSSLPSSYREEVMETHDADNSLTNRFPNFSQGLNLSSCAGLKETDDHETSLDRSRDSVHTSIESGIFCSDKSQGSSSSLYRHNSDCYPGNRSMTTNFTRNQSDPRSTRKFKEYRKWLEGGKKGNPPVQISHC